MARVKEALMDACEEVIKTALQAGVQCWCGYDAAALMSNLMDDKLVPAPMGVLVLAAKNPVLGPCFGDDIRTHLHDYCGIKI